MNSHVPDGLDIRTRRGHWRRRVPTRFRSGSTQPRLSLLLLHLEKYTAPLRHSQSSEPANVGLSYRFTQAIISTTRIVGVDLVAHGVSRPQI